MHLDLAADSENNKPNPKIRDLKIRFWERDKDGKRVRSKWTKAYGSQYAKILARFQPNSRVSKQTGFFVQRNDDNLVLFALATYVQETIGSYPYIPIIYDEITDGPMLPPERQSIDSYIVFSPDGENPAQLLNFTGSEAVRVLVEDGNCNSAFDSGNGEDLEIGPSIAAAKYPQSYWDERQQWLELIKNDYFSPACKLDISESRTCGDGTDLYATVTVYDSKGEQIYTTPKTGSHAINGGGFMSIEAAGLANPLHILGQTSPDFMAFTYGNYYWTTNTTEDSTAGPAYCTLKGKDWDGAGPQGCPLASPLVQALEPSNTDIRD